MSVLETVLVFVGIPLAIATLLALAVYGAGSRRTPRYRPGQPFEFTPVWFLSSPPRRTEEIYGAHAAVPGAPERRALGAGEPGDGERRAGEPRRAAVKGGARGTW